MNPNIFRLSIALAVVATIFSSCLKTDPPAPTTPPTYISVMHLAPSSPSLDVYFDNNKVSTAPLAPLNVTTAYNAVDRGYYAIKFKKAAGDSSVAEIPSAQYDSLSFYTIFLYNLSTNGPVKAVRFKDDFTDVIANPTKPFYRFYHVSPNTGAVDFYINDVKLESSRQYADNVGFDPRNKFLVGQTDYNKMEVKLAGTDTVIASLQNAYMTAGNAYTIYLKGLEGGTGTNELSLGMLRAAN